MKRYLYRSIGLHIAVFLALVLELPFFSSPKMTMGQAPIIVDLKDIKLAEMTNLPPKAVMGDEDKKATAPKEEKKPTQTWTKEEKKPEPKPEPEVKQEAPKKDFVDVTPEPEKKPEPKPEPKPKPKPVPKPQPKPKPVPKPQPKPKPAPKPKAPEPKKAEPKKEAPKKAEPKKQEAPKTITNPLKSLMDSVNTIEKQIGKEVAPAVIKTGTEVANMGVEGGTSGSYFSELTISETDAIAGKLRECWNLDPGVRGIENMIIEIRAFLNKDGSIKNVEILDKSRLSSDPHFRAIAESARRAVYSCSNKNNVNIYKVFADKYADKYDMWKTIKLRFNPMDASIK